jgi:WD40 repeat protein
MCALIFLFEKGLLRWSADGKFVATRNDNMPTAVWIWDVTCLELTTVLIQTDEVLSMAWSVEGHRLIICTASTRVFLWSPDGASCIHVPLPSFQAHSVQWSPGGGSFVLTDKDAFCCAFLTSS